MLTGGPEAGCLASRLETACAPNEILISYETYAHVKDLILCEERESINVKGIARPVGTFQVSDLYANLVNGNQHIRAKLPHFQLDVDVTSMLMDQRREALAVLQASVDQLTDADAHA